jgi:hypothetical protein
MEKNMKDLRQRVEEPVFEPSTFWIWSRSAICGMSIDILQKTYYASWWCEYWHLTMCTLILFSFLQKTTKLCFANYILQNKCLCVCLCRSLCACLMSVCHVSCSEHVEKKKNKTGTQTGKYTTWQEICEENMGLFNLPTHFKNYNSWIQNNLQEAATNSTHYLSIATSASMSMLTLYHNPQRDGHKALHILNPSSGQMWVFTFTHQPTLH